MTETPIGATCATPGCTNRLTAAWLKGRPFQTKCRDCKEAAGEDRISEHTVGKWGRQTVKSGNRSA